jgi:hypothetical protein
MSLLLLLLLGLGLELGLLVGSCRVRALIRDRLDIGMYVIALGVLIGSGGVALVVRMMDYRLYRGKKGN